jgi:uncharacterized protein YeaO (DUF488 family)
MIKTRSIYDDRHESDGTRILITRIYPRFIKKEHFDERMLILSPDRDTLHKWKHSKKTEEHWKRFEEKLLRQMKDLAAMEAQYHKEQILFFFNLYYLANPIVFIRSKANAAIEPLAGIVIIQA